MDLNEIVRKLIAREFKPGEKVTSSEGFEFEFISEAEFTLQPPGQEVTHWKAISWDTEDRVRSELEAIFGIHQTGQQESIEYLR